MSEPLRDRAPSLRRRLMLFVLGAVCLAALLQGVSAYRTALAEADAIFDYQMQQTALSISGATPGARHVMPEELELIIQGWSLDGLQLFAPPPRARLPQRAVMGFADVMGEDGRAYRVLSMQTGGQVVQVAQELAVRERLASRLAWRTITPIALVLPVLLLVVGWVIRQSLAPVERVRRQLSQRAAEDLTAVSEHGLPVEIRPLVRELNSLLERMRQAFEAQQHFVADAAHELRSPLTALKLQIEGLQRAGDEAARAQARSRLAAGVDRASHLVEQLLLLARQESGRGTAQALALEPLLRRVLAEQVGAAQARGIDLGLLRADAVQIMGWPDALAVLLRNLLDNAIKYSPEGGKVDVLLLDEGERARLRIEDSGPGIAPEERERVFDRFYRSAAAQTQAGGSGLGLAIVKTIAERHAAHLQLERSEALGGLRVDLVFNKT
ncbi:ATP-binding protein [Roseateles sp.]|uniref:ATP-binding protein n=1 Tax=Roseateles sp. TaxID=1971397 RepID=UPI00391C3477